MPRVLLLADTHLGFDLPARPRVERRRRGEDFFANTERALDRALCGDVDLVVHGGDLFHARSARLEIAERAYGLLRRVADAGVPVAIVPGNHERAALPYPLLARHPLVLVFDRPRTFAVPTLDGLLALGGFPYQRGVRARFRELVESTGLGLARAATALLCVHHCFEGARVGVHDWVFRDAPDVVRAADLPAGVAAVLTGHVHRRQTLTHDLAGRPLRAPVIYPGSVERTSRAEREEAKGYLLLDFDGGALTRTDWIQLDARPMLLCKVAAASGEDRGY